MERRAGGPALPGERFRELDQSIREALARRDGDLALHLATCQLRELRAAGERGEAGEAWMREARDRLEEQMRRARAARDALGAEISGLGVQRKLMGAPERAGGPRGGRSYRA